MSQVYETVCMSMHVEAITGGGLIIFSCNCNFVYYRMDIFLDVIKSSAAYVKLFFPYDNTNRENTQDD